MWDTLVRKMGGMSVRCQVVGEYNHRRTRGPLSTTAPLTPDAKRKGVE